jgi:hypothetical protein
MHDRKERETVPKTSGSLSDCFGGEGVNMTNDELRAWAANSATEIVKREGVALVMSACDRDGTGVDADSNLLGVAIAQAIVDAYQAGLASSSR